MWPALPTLAGLRCTPAKVHSYLSEQELVNAMALLSLRFKPALNAFARLERYVSSDESNFYSCEREIITVRELRTDPLTVNACCHLSAKDRCSRPFGAGLAVPARRKLQAGLGCHAMTTAPDKMLHSMHNGGACRKKRCTSTTCCWAPATAAFVDALCSCTSCSRGNQHHDAGGGFAADHPCRHRGYALEMQWEQLSGAWDLQQYPAVAKQ